MARTLSLEKEELKKLPLLQYLVNACKLFMLNLFEIVHWYTFLKRLQFNVKSAGNLVQSSACVAKKLLTKQSHHLIFENYF